MESLFGVIFWIIVVIFVVSAILTLPLIWYHIRDVSKKLSKIIELLENAGKKERREE
jgi:hypothetical protein